MSKSKVHFSKKTTDEMDAAKWATFTKLWIEEWAEGYTARDERIRRIRELYDMFKNGRGFSMTFQNGWTVSVQWHDGAYSDKNNATAEVAAWNKHGEWEVVDFFSMIKEIGDE